MKVVINLALTVVPVLLYLCSAFYLQRVAKGRLQSLVYGGALGFGGLGALVLIVTAFIPDSMPSPVVLALLALPMLLAAVVFSLRAGKKVVESGGSSQSNIPG